MPDQIREQPTRTFRAVLIGETTRREFRDLVSWLCGHPFVSVANTFADISTALQNDHWIEHADLTIVLQSWSEQFTAQEVDQLVGRTLSHRLLCSYGIWCESDGRNKSVWPDAVRVPLRLAESNIQHELNRSSDDHEPLPPTAARDEIFAHRLDTTGGTGTVELNAKNVAIVGPDRIMRRTVAMVLRDLGMRTVDVPLIAVDPRVPIRSQETPRGPIHVVIHDLDPWSPQVAESLDAARQKFPKAKIIGLATMPDAGLSAEIADEQLDGVVPKLDLQHGLQWHLLQTCGTTQS